jgi:CRISPR/Cas system CSM-associated protein Csm2 small subunit
MVVCCHCDKNVYITESPRYCSSCKKKMHSQCYDECKFKIGNKQQKQIRNFYELLSVYNKPNEHHLCVGCKKKIIDDFVPMAINYYQTTGRKEELAQLYEDYGMLEEAGKVRKTDTTIKHVSVNLNELIDQLKRGGLSVPVKCNACGATITVDAKSNASGLKFCSYCGSAMDTEIIGKVLKEALD